MKIALAATSTNNNLDNNLADFPQETLGVIERWDQDGEGYNGEIVVLKGNTLHTLANLIKSTGDSWSDFNHLKTIPGMRIRILNKDEKIEITV